MQIKKKTRIVVTTKREFTVRQVKTDERINCVQCGGEMIPEQVGADFFGVSSRVIYRFIEAGQIHFIESENEICVCSISLGNVLKTIH